MKRQVILPFHIVLGQNKLVAKTQLFYFLQSSQSISHHPYDDSWQPLPFTTYVATTKRVIWGHMLY